MSWELQVKQLKKKLDEVEQKREEIRKLISQQRKAKSLVKSLGQTIPKEQDALNKVLDEYNDYNNQICK